MQWFWSAVAERSGDTALAWTGPAVCQMSSTLDGADQSGVAASLCHRTPKSSRAEIIPGDTDRLESLRSIKCIHTHTTTCACATRSLLRPLLALSVAANCSVAWPPCAAEAHAATPAQVLEGLRTFFGKTARADGSFANGIDPQYRGMSDSAYSDLAAVTYAVTLHKTFGWKLPHEEATRRFLLSRQRPNGDFFNVAGTVDPKSAEGRVYNTTQGMVALRALGAKPHYDPLRVFEEILQQDYKTLPAYSTSFFPLAYLAYGQPIPTEADRRIRATMVQAPDGYLNDHIAATFHAAHYYRLVGEPTPMAEKILARVLRDQKADGSWMLNMPSRDRHATFDAVFTLRQLGHDRAECQAAIQKAARWVLACRNRDGGFGHFPGSTSDADANYFHVGTLVMAGFLKAVDPLPPDAHLLAWGHLMPLPAASPSQALKRESLSR